MLYAWFSCTYIPFLQKMWNYIGERNKLDKYSGGYTAWQDEKKSS
jgi:hypothetical protein